MGNPPSSNMILPPAWSELDERRICLICLVLHALQMALHRALSVITAGVAQVARRLYRNIGGALTERCSYHNIGVAQVARRSYHNICRCRSGRASLVPQYRRRSGSFTALGGWGRHMDCLSSYFYTFQIIFVCLHFSSEPHKVVMSHSPDFILTRRYLTGAYT